ncbi:MAG: hypothetical protein IKM57_02585 [Paludibacteraceae bacterium]|nr:hypothetical protein [Paludibacteraceae bacterium]
MTWLIVIIVVAIIGGIIGAMSSEDGIEGFLGGSTAAGFGCGYVIFQIFIGLLGLFLLFKLGSWLFS